MEYEHVTPLENSESMLAADPGIQKLIDQLYERFDEVEFEDIIRVTHAANFISENSSVSAANVYAAYHSLLSNKRVELPEERRGRQRYCLEKDHVVLLGVMGEVIKEDSRGVWKTEHWAEKTKDKLGAHPLAGYFKDPERQKGREDRNRANAKAKNPLAREERQEVSILDEFVLGDLIENPEGYQSLSLKDKERIRNLFELVNTTLREQMQFSPETAAKWCLRLLREAPGYSLEQIHGMLIKQMQK